MESPKVSVHHIPILQHVMYLTSLMWEGYLWAGSLCIVHSDNAATAEQLNLMGAISANAIVTIVVADEDPQEGIPD